MKSCKENSSNGFTLIELIVVIVIIAILIGVTVTGVNVYINKARINIDTNNASTLNSVLNTLSTKEEVQYWAKKSDETHIITWSYAKNGLATHGVNASYFIPSSDTGAGSFSNYSWSYLFQKYITYSHNTIDASYDGDTQKCLPQSKTGDGFMIIVTRDGRGNAIFHVYAMCNLSQSDLEYLKSSYNISASQWNWINGKGGRK